MAKTSTNTMLDMLKVRHIPPGSWVYVVMGSTGEYSDNREWPVRAFLDEGRAQAFVSQADEWLRKNKVASDSGHSILDYPMRGELTCPFDPSFSCDYTGTRYYYMAVELWD